MAVYDLEEQEQIDEIKAWWKEYRWLILLVVGVAAATFAGIQGWRVYQAKQSMESGELYSQLQAAGTAHEHKKVRDIANILAEQYPRTAYASFGALHAARAAVDDGDTAAAKTHLQWVVEQDRKSVV